MNAVAIGTVVPITNKRKVTNEAAHLGAYLMVQGKIRAAAFTVHELETIMRVPTKTSKTCRLCTTAGIRAGVPGNHERKYSAPLP